MFKENANGSKNEVLQALPEVLSKLKILESIRAESFVEWKFTEDDNCSVSEVIFFESS